MFLIYGLHWFVRQKPSKWFWCNCKYGPFEIAGLRLGARPSLVWMWVMRAGGGCFIRPACVRSGFPRGSWYVIRPSCLVQPLQGSVALSVTNSWPLRCVTLKEVEQESNPGGAKMMDGVTAPCSLTAQPTSHSLSLPMKSNYAAAISVCFCFQMMLSVWRGAGVSCFYICGLCEPCLYLFYLFSCLFYTGASAAFCSESACVGTCATEQKQFWRRILEMDGLLKIF